MASAGFHFGSAGLLTAVKIKTKMLTCWLAWTDRDPRLTTCSFVALFHHSEINVSADLILKKKARLVNRGFFYNGANGSAKKFAMSIYREDQELEE